MPASRRLYVDGDGESKFVGIAFTRCDDAKDDVGVGFYFVVIAEILDQPVAQLATGIVDEHFMLVGLRNWGDV